MRDLNFTHKAKCDPRMPSDASARAKAAVLVIVHGGEFGWGSGNMLNGSLLAAQGQLLVVTLNYRLDVFGFLARCEASSCAGNAGLTDLVAALNMLSNTLPSLGADPQAITLLGWGSGAALVSLLMASPITQPKNRLFRRAVLLDGTALAPWALNDHPQQLFMRLARELKVSQSVHPPPLSAPTPTATRASRTASRSARRRCCAASRSTVSRT